MNRFATAIILLSAACCLPVAGQDVTVSASLDSAIVTMGSQVRMTVTVNMPQDVAPTVQILNAPEIQNQGLGYGRWSGVDVVNIEADTTDADGRRRLTLGYTLQAFEPGLLNLQPISVLPAPGADTVNSDFLTLKVLPVEVDTISMAIMPLSPVANAHMRWHDYVPLWIPWILGLLILAVAGWIVWKKFRRKKEAVLHSAAKPVPPFELAMSRLNKLRASKTAALGHEKEFYTELTDILRQYLQGRFGINAMEMTSTQIVRTLRSNPDTRMPADQMDAVLRIADFVKFAKEKPLADDNERAMLRAFDFVQNTRPTPPPPPEANGNQPEKESGKRVKK